MIENKRSHIFTNRAIIIVTCIPRLILYFKPMGTISCILGSNAGLCHDSFLMAVVVFIEKIGFYYRIAMCVIMFQAFRAARLLLESLLLVACVRNNISYKLPLILFWMNEILRRLIGRGIYGYMVPFYLSHVWFVLGLILVGAVHPWFSDRAYTVLFIFNPIDSYRAPDRAFIVLMAIWFHGTPGFCNRLNCLNYQLQQELQQYEYHVWNPLTSAV